MRFLLRSLMIVLFIFLAACQNDGTDSVYFEDYQLEKIIRAEINKENDDILVEELQSITELDLSGKHIKSLIGIEHLDAVTKLKLQNNQLQSLSPLEEMDSLKTVYVGGNPYEESDIKRLESKNITVITKVEVEVRGELDGPGGYLWKIQNGDTTVFLQGTIHLATEDFFPLNRKIEEAYAEADVIVPEVDLNNMDMFEMQAIYMKYAIYEDGSTIQDHVSTDLYEELVHTYAELGYSIEMFAQYKPWFHSTLIQNLMTEKLKFIDGVDMYFLNRAEQDQKDIIALETAEDQLSIFAEVSPEYQVQMLEESLIEMDELETQMLEMFSLYKAGDGEKLLNYFMVEGEASAEEQAYIEALNDNRNYNMAEKIATFLEEDSGRTYFVIVGSLHLLQEPHIRSILEEEGYTIQQVL
ncbi:TraB/GumN family protein [Ornithinibacillus sp. 179-J 7C1 HS]|uniref:TraB/GumN family protein n=1 Tax=Ornithinibacillus sp. 179-J 7C1 HS TaxID=3142384 RepID=UPI0039A2E5A2